MTDHDTRMKAIGRAQELWAKGKRIQAISLLVDAGVARSTETASMMLTSMAASRNDPRPAPTHTLLKLPIPQNYSWIEHFGPQGEKWLRNDGLGIVETVSDNPNDPQEWHHCSCSYGLLHKLPSYADIAAMKHDFVGPDRVAVQVFPKTKEHVSIHDYTLHLFTNLTNPDYLPDFAPNGTI